MSSSRYDAIQKTSHKVKRPAHVDVAIDSRSPTLSPFRNTTAAMRAGIIFRGPIKK